ncbi:MAG: hypothetical protein QOC94_3465 [Actinoplanes sp.]|jgi:hypothetical protein|nr:hypothetical protein [Actinoplanes sp.]MDT5033294.1 hypothetical protein [Actinoplanes sp.]
MAVGSVGANKVPIGGPSPGMAAISAAAEARRAEKKAAAEQEKSTVADHVAAAEARGPIRSTSATLGTLVDTYL